MPGPRCKHKFFYYELCAFSAPHCLPCWFIRNIQTESPPLGLYWVSLLLVKHELRSLVWVAFLEGCFNCSSFYPTGPSHMSFYVRTHKGATLSQWSLGNGTPVTSKGGDYFVFYSHGLQASTWHFWIEVQVRQSHHRCYHWSGSQGGIWQDPWDQSVFCLLRARELINFLL